MVGERKAPDGYKVTEVGIIPEEWSIHRIGDEIDSLNSGVSVNSHEGDVSSNNPGILKTSSVSKGKFIPRESKRIIKRDLSRVKLNPKYDSLIISRMNTPELVGECGYVDRDYPFLFIPDRLWQTNFKQNSTINCKWLSYVLSSNKYRRIIKDIATGTSNSMKNITKDEFLEIYVPYPNKIEQDAIAEALSDTDNLILTLEKLIDKKKKIKQGAMQQLLTGKKRLPGFSGEWEVRRLGDIVSINNGQLITEKDAQDGTIPVIAGGKKPSYYHRFPNRQGKTITISASGANAGYVGFYTEPIFASDCSTIGENDRYSIEFIYYQLLMLQETIYYAQTGGAQPHIHPKDLKPLLINYTNLKEQKAIAQVLSDMDAGIEGLEEKLEKYKTIKQGMMQELLTGRIRLI